MKIVCTICGQGPREGADLKKIGINWWACRGAKHMPLNKKGKEIKRNMEKEYGAKKGKEVFYASENKGAIKGVTAEGRKGKGK